MPVSAVATAPLSEAFAPAGSGPGAPGGATGLAGDLARARAALLEATELPRPDDRFLAGHLVALRVAAVVLAVGARPSRTRRPRNAWRAVAEVVPALAGWASVFAATENTRDDVRAGATGLVSAAEADDLLAAVAEFLEVVDRALTAGAGPAGTAARAVRR